MYIVTIIYATASFFDIKLSSLFKGFVVHRKVMYIYKSQRYSPEFSGRFAEGTGKQGKCPLATRSGI